jgi:Sulfotransferase family
MDYWNIDPESSDDEDWKSHMFEERIDYYWLNYNPHALLPLDDYFYRTGTISKIQFEQKIPSPGWNPCFAIGCGRSGTTIIAKILSVHPDLCFLNEPRTLWMQIFPSFDVWSVQASSREGQLRMKKTIDPNKSKEINSLLYTITEMVGKSSLIEKTPENTFRLDWLNSLFPNSKFIMVKRNPIQTARSISRFQPDTWFGFNQYKWRQLLELLKHFNVKFI